MNWIEKIDAARNDVNDSTRSERDRNNGIYITSAADRAVILLLDHAEAVERRLKDLEEDTRVVRAQQRGLDEH